MTIIHKVLPLYKPKGMVKEDKPLGGIMIDWGLYRNLADGFTCRGTLVVDNLQRFEANTSVHTSNVEELHYDTNLEEGWIVTRNTRYYLSKMNTDFDLNGFLEQTSGV